MAGSVNKVILVGNLGRDPEIRSVGDSRVAGLNIATSESWKDRNSGDRKEKTEWHRVSVWPDALVSLAENHLRKGSKVYIEGKLETRKVTGDDGNDRYFTEVVLRQFGGVIQILSAAGNSDAPAGGEEKKDAEIPF